MRKLLSKLWEDDGGFIISLELLFIAVILVIGIIAGFGNLRVAMITTYSALANAVLGLDPGYEILGISGDTAGSEGSLVTYGNAPIFNGATGLGGNFNLVNVPVLEFKAPISNVQAYNGIPANYVP